MFGDKKVPQSLVDAVSAIMEAGWDKEKTPTGTKVYGSSYGDSKKARKDQTKSSVDDVKGPKEKEMKEEKEEGHEDAAEDKAICKDVAKKEVKKHEKKMHKEGFAGRLISSHYEMELVEAQIQEVLSKDASAGDWIHDFVHSDNPKFKGKSKAMRKKMALAAYYSKQRNEEIDPDVRTKDMIKGRKPTSQKDDVGPGSDSKSTKVKFKPGPMGEETIEEETPKKGQDVADKSWLKSAGKKPSTLHNVGKGLKAFMTGKKEPMESVEVDGEQLDETGKWHSQYPKKDQFQGDELKKREFFKGNTSTQSLKRDMKKGLGFKALKMKEEVVDEAKRPEQDDVPFAPPYNTTSQPVVTDKSGAKHTPMSRAKDLARTAMKKIKTEMLGKAPGNN